MVAGSAANLRDAFYSLGHGAHTSNAYRFLVNMLLMGDGWNGWSFGTAEYGFDTTKPNRRSGSAGRQIIASQTDYDWRNRIRSTASQIGGKCLEMRVYGFAIRPEGLWVDMADMYHG